LTTLQPLHVRPEQPVFVTTLGTQIEPKTFSAHWHDGLRACGIRQRGLYTTKDTNVTTALSGAGVTPAPAGVAAKGEWVAGRAAASTCRVSA